MSRAVVATLALALTFSAGRAQTAGEATPRPGTERGVITTRATAHRRLPNTVADVSVSIQAHGPSAAAVRRMLAVKSQSLVGWLRTAGTERLTTDTITVEPQTETDRGHGLPDRIVGYNGTLAASFRVVVDKLPDLLDGSLAHGANDIGQTTLTPREDEIDAARQELAAEASALAFKQVTAVANATGRRVDAVTSIAVDPIYPTPDEADLNPYAPRRALDAMKAPPVPQPQIAVAAGISDMSVTVAMTARFAP